jgi:hypothetical protein
MIPAAVYAWMVPALLGTTEVSYEVGARSEVRASSDPFPQSGTPVDGAQEIVPRASILLHLDEWSLLATYYPRIYWFEPQSSSAPNVVNRALLQIDRKLGTNRTATVSEDFGYGLNYFSPLGGTAGATAPGTPEPLQPLPAVLFAQYVSSYSTASTSLELSHLWHLYASASYVVSGGADSTAQLEIPLQRGPRADASVSYAVSRLDSWVSSVSALHSNFTSGQSASMAQLVETWQRRFSPTFDGSVSAGAAAVQNQAAIGDPSNDLLPVAALNANLKDRLGGQLTAAHLTLAVGPFLDVYAAEVYERAEADLGAGIDYEHWALTTRARGTVLLTGYERRGESLVTLELATSHLLDKGLLVEGGVRGFWQQGLLVVGSPFQWTLFLSLSGTTKGVVGG